MVKFSEATDSMQLTRKHDSPLASRSDREPDTDKSFDFFKEKSSDPVTRIPREGLVLDRNRRFATQIRETIRVY